MKDFQDLVSGFKKNIDKDTKQTMNQESDLLSKNLDNQENISTENTLLNSTESKMEMLKKMNSNLQNSRKVNQKNNIVY